MATKSWLARAMTNLNTAKKYVSDAFEKVNMNLTLSVKNVWQRNRSSSSELPITAPPVLNPVTVDQVAAGVGSGRDGILLETNRTWPILVGVGVAIFSVVAGGYYFLRRNNRSSNGCQVGTKNYYSCTQIVNNNFCCCERRNNSCLTSQRSSDQAVIDVEGNENPAEINSGSEAGRGTDEEFRLRTRNPAEINSGSEAGRGTDEEFCLRTRKSSRVTVMGRDAGLVKGGCEACKKRDVDNIAGSADGNMNSMLTVGVMRREFGLMIGGNDSSQKEGESNNDESERAWSCGGIST